MAHRYSQAYHHLQIDRFDGGSGEEQQQQYPQHDAVESSLAQKDPNNHPNDSKHEFTNEVTNQVEEENQTNIKKLRVSWAMEIGAVILSLAALIAIVVLLIVENGKPLSDWKAFFSLNTFVSILGVVAHSSIAFAVSSCVGQEKWNWFRKRADNVFAFKIFDDASRGPMGSMQLVWWLRVSHLATLGAITTIILIGFDPFLQAIITYDGSLDNVSDGLNISIPRTTRLDTGPYQDDAGNGISVIPLSSPYNISIQTTSSFSSQPDMGMSAAVFNGFDNPSVAAKSIPSVSCSSGNCTWPLFTSLAVCSTCNDVTAHINKSRVRGAPHGNTNVQSFDGEFTSYSLPGINIANFDGKISTSDQASTNMGFLDMAMAAIAKSNHSATLTFQDSLNMITSVIVMRADNSYINGTTIWEETPVTATECALYLCTKLYSSSVVQGKVMEVVIDSWSRRNMDSFQTKETPGFANLTDTISKAWAAQEGYPLVFRDGDLYREDLQLYMTREDVAQYSFAEPLPLQFNISQSAITSTVLWIESFFTTSVLKYGANGLFSGQPPVVQSLGASKDLNATFSSVSQSMTNWVRNSAGTPQPGTMQQWVIHTRVRWGFMAGPFVAILSGSLFTILSIFNTRRLRLPSWKSDALATMVYGLDDEQREGLRLADETGNLKKAAKQLSVQLEETEKGAHLETYVQKIGITEL